VLSPTPTERANGYLFDRPTDPSPGLMDAAQANFTRAASIPHFDGGGSPTVNGGRTTPPSPFTDSSSSPTAISASASTPTTDLTSLLSEAAKLSLETVKRSSLGEPPAVTWPYSQASALDDIPGVAHALDLFLKSLMVESEEYCHTSDPKKCAIPNVLVFFLSLKLALVAGNVCISLQASA